MDLTPSANFVKRSLASHSWLGLLVGALMYLVCLSGTLSVFYTELERWEQPQIPESVHYDPGVLERAYHEIVGNGEHFKDHVFVQLPTEETPRASISTENAGWFINSDGSRGEKVNHEWTHLLVNLHLYLHLPESFGMILVSALGAILCGLVVSGLLAHPRLFKDAFVLRLGGSRPLEQADIHNRLSVWSAPFQLMIGITGAFFGLAQIVALLLAQIYSDGDALKLLGKVYGEEPKLEQTLAPLAIAKAIEHVRTIAPHTTPAYISVEKVNEPGQFMLVGAQVPGRLIYVEQYRFDTAGHYLGKVGFEDGPVGRQMLYSTYRLHFGQFGGFSVRVLYFVLGLAVSIVSVTGFNIWLAKRKRRDTLNNVWVALVWGTVPGLALSAIAQVLFGIPATAVLWLAIAAACGLAQWWDDEVLAKRRLQIAGAITIGALVAGHTIKFGAATFNAVPLGVNAGLLASAAVLLFMGVKLSSKPTVSARDTTAGSLSNESAR